MEVCKTYQVCSSQYEIFLYLYDTLGSQRAHERKKVNALPELPQADQRG